MIAYLRLVRLPNVFTSIADIVAGYAIIRAKYGSQEGPGYDRLLALCGASAGLYMAGMAFNDIADRDEDAELPGCESHAAPTEIGEGLASRLGRA